MKFLTHALFAVVLALFSAITFAQAININTATAEELDKGLKGIGPVKAAEIVKYREVNGPFKSVDDLVKVSGVGDKTLAAIKDMLTVGGAAEPATPAVPAVPATSATPVAPVAPVAPATPTVPATSAMPATPVAPVAPATPVAPASSPKP